MPEPDDKLVLKGGATRSERKLPFYLLPLYGLRGLMRRLHLGAFGADGKKGHGINNWKSGEEDFLLECISHLGEHLLQLNESGNSGDFNSDAILCNALFIADMYERKPEVWKKVAAKLGWPEQPKPDGTYEEYKGCS